MDGSDDNSAGGEVAEKVIQRWDSSSSNEARDRMLFEGSDRTESDRYLRAVDEIRRLSLQDPPSTEGYSPRRSSTSASDSLQLAMARLEDEFRNILVSRVNTVEADSLLSDLASVSMSSVDFVAEDVDGSFPSSGRQNDDFSVEDEEEQGVGGDDGGESKHIVGSSWRRSMSNIREIDLMPIDAVQDLRSISERMIAAGYTRECFQAYSGVRKAAVDQSLRQLGVERHSIGEVQRLDWQSLERKIRQWIRAARACVRIIFASERRLCDLIFEGLALDEGSGPEVPFSETVKGAALQLFGFAEAISIGRRSPEKLFKILDLHDTLLELLPDVEAVFLRPDDSSESLIRTQAGEILSRLAEAARGTLSEFESAVYREQSRTLVPGGTIHPMTRYVMNYIGLICEYTQTLSFLIVSKPSQMSHNSTNNAEESSQLHMDVRIPQIENDSPLAAHLIWVIAILESNVDAKAKLYKDSALGHIFLMNNLHYIVQKAKVMLELRKLIGDEYLKKLTGKFQQVATNYERATWVKVLHCLRDEGIHVSGSFSSGVSKSTLKERFKSFNATFEEAHKTQAGWIVPDPQLREELRISISEKLLPAYRSFLGRFRSHIETGRHPEMFIKYSVDDLEMALSDFFEGASPTMMSRRKPH
ncbi:exocyst subunit exo70 family protein D3 [Zostera marina]|uniref:Exocyst subunit Exo70 family protein n=1 Tax=Zostera marina TaxID=29655 RepID=A0A0K9PS18_ZOSMR|nr:exocyst subunit exo70 family protein D3 [Zostera marina]